MGSPRVQRQLATPINREEQAMTITAIRFRAAWLATAALAGGGLGGCATEDYVDEQIATVNSRIDQTASQLNGRIDAVDGTAQEALQRAQAAEQAAAAAAAAAQQASSVRRAGERG
jgi:hypothetical protein